MEVEKPFAFEEELKEKTERLNALNIELNLNEKDTPVIDDEPELDEETPEKENTAVRDNLICIFVLLNLGKYNE